MGGLTRREALKAAGVGALALSLPGCGGSSELRAASGSPDEWRQFEGTTLNFISENTAPTLAIAANLEPFEELTGIRIKIVAARARGARAEGGAGLRERARLLPAHLRRSVPDPRALPRGAGRPQRDDGRPEPAQAGGPRRLHPDPARRRRQVRRQREALRAALRRADDDLAVPQGPVREARRPDEAGPRVRPDAVSDESTWEEFYKTSKWFKENASKTTSRTATAPRPSSTTR